MTEKIDPGLLQARWVLNGIRPEDLPDLAALALEQGYDGSALSQLAGLVKPTLADLENLPQKAFADMGLPPIEKDAAVTVLLQRGVPPTNPTVSVLLENFPDFMPRWRDHLAWWGGEPAGAYNDMSQFVHFVVEDLYEKGKHDEVKRVFLLFENLLDGADQETIDLIGIGFLETLQNVASWRPYGNRVFKEFLGTQTKQIWREIERIWAGKSSLMDVLRAERKTKS
ncbi:MAG TPA: hypothetical protein VKH81_17010 [Candidatus Angelobacter sp.]|nr:hypothetical protein [Candidatus Angelobacter sp.]